MFGYVETVFEHAFLVTLRFDKRDDVENDEYESNNACLDDHCVA